MRGHLHVYIMYRTIVRAAASRREAAATASRRVLFPRRRHSCLPAPPFARRRWPWPRAHRRPSIDPSMLPRWPTVGPEPPASQAVASSPSRRVARSASSRLDLATLVRTTTAANRGHLRQSRGRPAAHPQLSRREATGGAHTPAALRPRQPAVRSPPSCPGPSLPPSRRPRPSRHGQPRERRRARRPGGNEARPGSGAPPAALDPGRPAGWGVLRLTARALRELNRRAEARPRQRAAPAAGPVPTDLGRFARGGGLDLRRLRGVSRPSARPRVPPVQLPTCLPVCRRAAPFFPGRPWDKSARRRLQKTGPQQGAAFRRRQRLPRASRGLGGQALQLGRGPWRALDKYLFLMLPLFEVGPRGISMERPRRGTGGPSRGHRRARD